MLDNFRKGHTEAPRIRAVTDLKGDGDRTIAHVLDLSPEGYIVVSADTDIAPVLCYSFFGNFPHEDRGDNVLLHLIKWDLGARHKGLQVKSAASEQDREAATTWWHRYLTGDSTLVRELAKAGQWPPTGDGWITTRWHQRAPFNDFCPVDPNPASGPDPRCPVGCTATSMAQILHYWQYPKRVQFGSDDSYTSSGRHGTIDIPWDAAICDFATFADLNSMLDQVDYSDTTDQAALCFGAGIKLHMEYSNEGSGAWRPSAYLNGFGYGSTKSNDDGWSTENREIAIENIKDAYPVQISIFGVNSTGKPVGHSVVLDGYKGDGRFHINFGWGPGGSTTWYSLPDITSVYNVVGGFIHDIAPYYGFHQSCADERNSWRCPYAAPTDRGDGVMEKWRVTCSGDYHFVGVVVGSGNRIYASVEPTTLGSVYHPSLWVISEYGEKLSEYPFTEENGNICVPAVNSLGNVIVWTGSSVHMLDVQTGQISKIFQTQADQINTESPGDFAPKIDSEDNIYVSFERHLYRLAPSGEWNWTFSPPDGAYIWRGTPAVNVRNNTVYVGFAAQTNAQTQQGFINIGCIDRRTGVLLDRTGDNTVPTRELPHSGTASISDDGTVYCGIHTGLTALAVSGGNFSQEWATDYYPSYIHMPAIGSNGTLYLTRTKMISSTEYAASLLAVDPTTGNTMWEKSQIPQEYPAYSHPYVTKNGVIVYLWRESEGHIFHLLAYRDTGDDAQLLWDWNLGDAASPKMTLAFGPGETIYVPHVGGLSAITDGHRENPDEGAMGWADNRAPIPPTNPSPADGSANLETTVNLSWDCTDPDGNARKYRLYVCPLNAEDVLFVREGPELTSNSYQLSGLAPGTKYLWEVVATDGQAVSEGPTWAFAVAVPGDFDGDGHVNLVDFNILVNHWQNPYTLVDFNNLVNHWGT